MNSSTILAYYTVNEETAGVVMGFSLNLILLFLIKRFSSAYLGNYKYLLAVFACYDVYLSVLHGLCNPVVIIVPNTFGATLYTPFQSDTNTSIFYSSFTVPFALMCIHFLYRYWSIASPDRLTLFSRPLFVFLISLYPITQWSVWFTMGAIITASSDDYTLDEVKVEFYKTRSQPVHTGWVVMDHWRDGQLNVTVLFVIFVTMFIIFGSLILASTLATLTYREILKTTTLTTKHRTMQYALFVAVCAQTFVPVFCVYVPYFFIIMCPFLRISSGIGFIMANHFSLFVSIFPGWDALVIICLVRDYRMGFLKMTGLWKEKKIIVRQTQFTTAFSASVAPQGSIALSNRDVELVSIQ